MRKNYENEARVGIFVAVGVALLLLTVILLDDSHSFFSKKINYTTHFKQVDGLITGAKVILNGVPVGVVDSIDLDLKQRDIRVQISVEKTAQEWVVDGSKTQIETQGVLGDKYIRIEGGEIGKPILPAGADIPSSTPHDFSQLVSEGGHLVGVVTSIAANLDELIKTFTANRQSETFFKELVSASQNLARFATKLNDTIQPTEVKNLVRHMEQIIEKIDNGTGSIGALINDPSLYDHLKSLLGGANRNRIIRNLVRQTIRESESSSPTNAPPPPHEH